MPDAFLLRVMAQRNREQYLRPAEVLRRCVICDKALRPSASAYRTVCARCGGRERQRKLEQQMCARQGAAQ